MQPADKQMRAHSAVEEHGGDGDIGNVWLQVGSTGCRNLYRHVLEQVENYRNIVRSETPQRILFTPYFAEVQAVGVDVLDAAEFARIDQFFKLVDGGVKLQEMADHEDAAQFLPKVRQALGFV